MKFALDILSTAIVTVMVLILGTFMEATVEWTPWELAQAVGLWILFWASIDFHVFTRSKKG